MIKKNWQVGHAIALFLATILAVMSGEVSILLGTAMLSFLLFIVTHYPQVREIRPWGGYANWITAFRLLLIMVVGFSLEDAQLSLWPAVVLVLTLCLDGLDGFVARRSGMTSEVGGHFDMETDAYFVLFLGVHLFQLHDHIWWVVAIGIWRYVYVLILHVWVEHDKQEPSSMVKKTVTVWTIGSMIIALFVYNIWVEIVLASSLIFTSLSFVHSLYFQLSGRWIKIS